MTRIPDAEPTTTQLRDYYAALFSLKEEEQTVLAEAHAKDPTRLIHRFVESVKMAELRVRQGVEAFHYRDPLAPAESLAEIKSTIGFARQLVDRKCVVADPHSELGFAYVDREIFPGRTTGPARMRKRTADLLLVDIEQRLPIVGELKIGGDRPTYFAFIQALMHATELVSETQRARLKREYGQANFSWPDDGPYLDLFLIAYEPPQAGEFRERSTAATEAIARKMIAAGPVDRSVELDQRDMPIIRLTAKAERNATTRGVVLHEHIPITRDDHVPRLHDLLDLRPPIVRNGAFAQAIAQQPGDDKAKIAQKTLVLERTRHASRNVGVGPKHSEEVHDLRHECGRFLGIKVPVGVAEVPFDSEALSLGERMDLIEKLRGIGQPNRAREASAQEVRLAFSGGGTGHTSEGTESLHGGDVFVRLPPSADRILPDRHVLRNHSLRASAFARVTDELPDSGTHP